MYTLALITLQAALTLASVITGAHLIGKSHKSSRGEPPTTPAVSSLDFLPEPGAADVTDIQRGMSYLTGILKKIENKDAASHDYEEARGLTLWLLGAGKAAEESLAKRILREERDERMPQEEALKVVERCVAAGVPQRAIAAATGWSKGWVHEQCKSLSVGVGS